MAFAERKLLALGHLFGLEVCQHLCVLYRLCPHVIRSQSGIECENA